MPKHKPIKFETTLEEGLAKQIKDIVTTNKAAESVANATLALIALGGIITLGAVAPGALGELNRFLYRANKEKRERYNQVWRSFYSLKQKGNLEFVEEKNGYLVYRLTEKGKEKIKKLIFNELTIAKPKNGWDGKWRLVIFDIPESHYRARDILRRKLQDMGFYQCQKSAWIYPFPCLEEIEFLKDFYNIKPFVKLFLVEEMTDGRALYHFRELIKEVT